MKILSMLFSSKDSPFMYFRYEAKDDIQDTVDCLIRTTLNKDSYELYKKLNDDEKKGVVEILTENLIILMKSPIQSKKTKKKISKNKKKKIKKTAECFEQLLGKEAIALLRETLDKEDDGDYILDN